jgi:hypothetical protein
MFQRLKHEHLWGSIILPIIKSKKKWETQVNLESVLLHDFLNTFSPFFSAEQHDNSVSSGLLDAC